MITQRERYLMTECFNWYTDGGARLTCKQLDDWLYENVNDAGLVVEELLSHEADRYSKERIKLMESSDYRAQLAAEGKLI